MKVEAIMTALAESRDFIMRAEEALARVETFHHEDGTVMKCIDPCKETGALRRKSMDLTRSLADLRR